MPDDRLRPRAQRLLVPGQEAERLASALRARSEVSPGKVQAEHHAGEGCADAGQAGDFADDVAAA